MTYKNRVPFRSFLSWVTWYDLTWKVEEKEQIWARKVEELAFDSKFHIAFGIFR